MKVFKKRVFTPIELTKRSSLFWIYSPALIRGLISPTTSRQLREKVMLAVTSVNDCRYCSWAHTHLALNNGVNMEEIEAILRHEKYQASDPGTATAIMYAQHYADTNGKVNGQSKYALMSEFGIAQRIEIHAYIHAIYMGNLAGNTFDALISRFKGYKVQDSSLVFELIASLFSAPVLLYLLSRSKKDKRIGMAEI